MQLLYLSGTIFQTACRDQMENNSPSCSSDSQLIDETEYLRSQLDESRTNAVVTRVGAAELHASIEETKHQLEETYTNIKRPIP